MRYASHDSGYEPPRQLSTAFTAMDQPRARAKMIQELQNKGITDPNVLTAMKTVPRHLYVPKTWAHHAYQDMSLPIGLGQTISQPSMVARMLEFMKIKKGMRILEIGMGSGYQTTLLAAMGCEVYSIERLKTLYKTACAKFRKTGYRNIHPFHGDGTLGLPLAAPFDRIIVAAGGPVVPTPLLSQIEEDGLLLIPVGPTPRVQRLIRICKHNGQYFHEDLGAADFVHLIGDHGWNEKNLHQKAEIYKK